MTRGKEICGILKDIRRRIAEANGIEYVAAECRYEGDCSGTCPRCEAEAAALWRQLDMRRAAGRAVVLAGLSAGLLTASAQSSGGAGQGCGSCHSGCQPAEVSSRNPAAENVDTIKVVHNSCKAEPRLSADKDDRQLFGAINEVMPQFVGGVNAMADYVKSSVDTVNGSEEGVSHEVVVVGFPAEEDEDKDNDVTEKDETESDDENDDERPIIVYDPATGGYQEVPFGSIHDGSGMAIEGLK